MDFFPHCSLMKIILHTEAPDGTVEHLDVDGNIIIRSQALASPIICSDNAAARAMLDRATKLWSVRQDCFVRSPAWEEVSSLSFSLTDTTPST